MPHQRASFGSRREFGWLLYNVLLRCHGHRRFFGLLPWLIRVRVFAGQKREREILHLSSPEADSGDNVVMGVCCTCIL